LLYLVKPPLRRWGGPSRSQPDVFMQGKAHEVSIFWPPDRLVCVIWLCTFCGVAQVPKRKGYGGSPSQLMRIGTTHS